MIELSHVDVTFKPQTPLERRALIGIDLTIDRGSFVTIIGANGSGKSTLLGVLAGTVIPTEGKVMINGRNVSRESISERAGRIAYVFQDSLVGSCGSLTIEENLALASCRGHRRGFRSALNREKRKLFREKIAQLDLGLEDFMHDRMDRLSGGQRQAVCLMMTTLAHTDVLLLDEHTAALDPFMADFVMCLTNNIVKEKGLTTIMVTHSMRQALDYGDRILMLHGGRVVLDAHQEERKHLSVQDLIQMFQKVRGDVPGDDNLLMD